MLPAAIDNFLFPGLNAHIEFFQDVVLDQIYALNNIFHEASYL